ncbi:hypothetical protein RASY3_03625 [Ruminococcus albus SY3]|uniref:Uncharacterized protein n=1 Tax=Ruminococcus albus SY3 TaxID=1341156 RepID=A0A011UKC0_RUMAL|nr:hypothetical protein RASY3_03625 [Ruminococcus albus SY3]
MGKNAKETKRAVKPRASRLAGARGQSPRIKAQNQNAKRALKAKQSSALKKGAAIKELRAWTNFMSTLFLRP